MDIAEVRRRNARLLATECGTDAEFARRIARSPGQVNAIIGPNWTRDIGKRLARHIERSFVKPDFWLDEPHFLDYGIDSTEANGGEVMESGPPVGTYKAAPVVGTAELGPEGYWTELEHPVGHGDGVVDIPSRDPNVYALRVVGDSMAPAIRSGWIVVVEPSRELVPGEFVLVVTRDGRSMVKEFIADLGDDIYLMSVNQEVRPLTLQKDRIEKIHYVGFIVPPSKLRI